MIKDSLGNVVKAGHILEVKSYDADHAEKYHIAYESDWHDDNNGYLDTIDGNGNSMGMSCYPDVEIIGWFWEHLDKVSDFDLRYLFGLTRETAEVISKLKSKE